MNLNLDELSNMTSSVTPMEESLTESSPPKSRSADPQRKKIRKDPLITSSSHQHSPDSFIVSLELLHLQHYSSHL